MRITIGTFDVATTTANAQGGFANVTVRFPEFDRAFQKPMTATVSAVSSPDVGRQADRQIDIT